MLKEYIINNKLDFNDNIKSEEDLKIKIILPYLESLGYHRNEMRFENSIEVIIGTKKTTVFSDIEIELNGKVELLIDIKRPSVGIGQKDILQAQSYAKLINTPPAILSSVTNGLDTITTNTFTGEQMNGIPSKAQLMKIVNNSKKKIYTEIQLQEVRSVLLTLVEPNELYKIINNSKKVIEKKALIRSDQSFKEISKIILVKMNEERRVKNDEGQNRFSKQYLIQFAQLNGITVLESFTRLFDEARSKYPDIYEGNDGFLKIADEEALLRVVDDFSPFSFLGTGDDIKGAVYEIFLKGTLRGDFDQYFTPRELVDFVINLANPEIDDTFLDPACGSRVIIMITADSNNGDWLSSPLLENKNMDWCAF